MRRGLLFVLLITALLLPNPVNSHGGPPFILVNGKPNQSNLAASGSVFFKVPNEIAAENFVVNQTVTFSVDKNLLPVSPETLKPEDFLWAFGNSKTGAGLSASTTYTKSGSYVDRKSTR